MSVLPDVGSKLPTDSDEAAVVRTALVDEAVDNALDMVGLHVVQSCFRTDSEDALLVLLEEHSLMNDAVLVIQDFLSTDNCGDDRFSPGVRNHVSLNWQVHLHSHRMIYWEGRWNGEDGYREDGYRAGVSDWRSVLCCVALMSRLPEFPDTDCLNCFNDIGKNCVMDLSAWGTCPLCPLVRPPEWGLETFAQTSPNQQECLVSDVPYGAVTQVRGCAQMRGKRAFPGRDGVRGRLGLYKAGD